eukprot:11198694-Lingulodinium_polyedra.AAC.1
MVFPGQGVAEHQAGVFAKLLWDVTSETHEAIDKVARAALQRDEAARAERSKRGQATATATLADPPGGPATAATSSPAHSS